MNQRCKTLQGFKRNFSVIPLQSQWKHIDISEITADKLGRGGTLYAKNKDTLMASRGYLSSACLGATVLVIDFFSNFLFDKKL